MKKTLLLFYFFSLCLKGLLAQDSQLPCLSPSQYAEMEKRIKHNEIAIGSKIRAKKAAAVLFAWPVRAAASLKDCSFYRVAAYVDHNPASGAIQDFNCGTQTYDGHTGTDIATFPFNFYKMDNNLVEVVAAASGVILDKHDGEFDRNCGTNSSQANYLIIQHEDGSRTIYAHLKKLSLTAKTIGQSVVQGEYLGVVGSSGNSSGPHLHFEVWSGSTSSTRIDPFAGTCNVVNPNSKWVNQKAHKETAIIKASVNTTDIVLPPCPTTETLNESNVFAIPFQGPGLPAGFAKFYIFMRDEVAGLSADLAILNPDASIHTGWTVTSSSNAGSRFYGWSKKLPVTPGLYTFRASYNGINCLFPFTISGSNGLGSLLEKDFPLVFPNPSKGKIQIKMTIQDEALIQIFNSMGDLVFERTLSRDLQELETDLPSGLYFYHIQNAQQFFGSGKLVIE